MRRREDTLRLDRSPQVEDGRATKRQRLPGAHIQAALPVFSSPPAAAAQPKEVASAVPRGLIPAATLAAFSSPALPPIPPIPHPRASGPLLVPDLSQLFEQENLAGHQLLAGHHVPFSSPPPAAAPDGAGDAVQENVVQEGEGEEGASEGASTVISAQATTAGDHQETTEETVSETVSQIAQEAGAGASSEVICLDQPASEEVAPPLP